MAWIDISTGTFRTTTTNAADLASDLARIEPSELILSQTLFDHEEIKRTLIHQKTALTPLPSNLFDSARAEHQLCAYFNVKSLDGFGTFTLCELSSAAAILTYVEKTQLAQKPALSHPQSENSIQTMLIDAATRSNLEFNKNPLRRARGFVVKGNRQNAERGGCTRISAKADGPAGVT